MLLRFVAFVMVITVLALDEVRANSLIFAAYQNAQSALNSDSALSETSFGNYYTSLEQYLELAVHRDGPESAYISEKANLIQDVDRFFNIPTFQDMEFEEFPDLANDITGRIRSICPAFDIQCDDLAGLTYRPINNFCNNKLHPRWGNPKIAQLRLAPALWETTHLISLLFDVVGVMLPLDPYGAQLFPAGVLKPLVFHLSGNAGFKLAVLRPYEICVKRQCVSSTSGQGSCSVDGIVHTITLLEQISQKKGPCLPHVTYSNVGNQVKVVDGCSAVFEVCYQPRAAVIHIEQDEGEISYIEVYDEEGGNPETVSEYQNPKLLYPQYGSGDPGSFWLDFQEGVILVGYGSECNPGTGILKAEFDIEIIKSHLKNSFRYSLAAEVLQSKIAKQSVVHCDVPTTDVLQLETHISDKFSKIRTLDSFPFLHASASVRFGLRTDLSSSTVKVDLIDTSHELKVTLTFGLQDGDSNIKVFYQGVLDEKLQQTLGTPSLTGQFMDGNGASRSGFAPFWVTWLGNRIYTGTGNVLGKSANEHFLDLGFSHYLFTVDHVILHSTLHTDWLFDIVQWGVPRKTSTSGRPLPSARDVSLAVHSNIGGAVAWSSRLTMAVMQMGQFLDHDLIATPTESVHGCEPISCCVDGQPVPLDQQSRFCFNIDVTTKTDSNGNQGSFPSTNTSCLPFTRSATIIECDELLQELRNREQMNVLTSFIDASNVYGSEIETARQLRDGLDHTGAFLRSDRGLELPQTTEAGEIPCNNNDNPHLLCRKGGDFRAMEQPMLASMHTLWLREHNRLVQGLLDLGSGYSLSSIAEREILYQTARKILIAEMQVVAYDGYLPSFMDGNIMKEYGMKQGGCAYDPRRNPGIRNEWGIANRMGHTWVSGLMEGSSGASLVINFFSPIMSYSEGSDPMLKAMADNKCPETDKLIEDALTEHLFRVGADANDLASLNVQRGRDHGVSYCRARGAFANLRVPKNFKDLITYNIIPEAAVKQLMKCYDCVCDIDLFTGIVIETPLKDRPDYTSDSTNGELLNFILAEFFGDAKCGDRYWYEFPDSTFSKAQIKALYKSSLSRVLCDNQVGTNITEIQPDAFRIADAVTNPITSCDAHKKIPKLNLKLFPRKLILTDVADSVKSPARRTEGNGASVNDDGLVNLSDRNAEEGRDEQNEAMHTGRADGAGYDELSVEVIAGRTAKGGESDAVGGDGESEIGMTDDTGIERDMTEDTERQRYVEREKKVKELEEIHHLLEVLKRLEDK